MNEINYHSNNFQANLLNLCAAYMNDDSNKATSYKKVYKDIKDYYNDKKMECFSYLAFTRWLNGEATPDSRYICLLCDFFKCDANYLFSINQFDQTGDLNQPFSKIDSYILKEYGLDKKTLDFFKKHKGYAISTDDVNAINFAVNPKHSFAALFNELIHNSPWLINNLLQIIHMDELGLSDFGFAKTEDILSKYQNFPGMAGHLISGHDIDVAITLLSVRLKYLLKNPGYIPNPSNLVETFDPNLVNENTVDSYVSDLISNRLKNLNKDLTLLTEIITKEPE